MEKTDHDEYAQGYVGGSDGSFWAEQGRRDAEMVRKAREEAAASGSGQPPRIRTRAQDEEPGKPQRGVTAQRGNAASVAPALQGVIAVAAFLVSAGWASTQFEDGWIVLAVGVIGAVVGAKAWKLVVVAAVLSFVVWLAASW